MSSTNLCFYRTCPVTNTLANFFDYTSDLIVEITEIIQPLSQGEAALSRKNTNKAYGLAHTLKGMARTVNFTDLANTIHDFEQLFVKGKKSETNANAFKYKDEMLRDLETIRSTYASYLDIYKKLRLDWMQNLDTGDEMASTFIEQIISDNISIASDLNKPIPKVAVITKSDTHIGCQEKSLLTRVLTHLTRNFIDHGIEHREERLKAGKNERGLITVKISRLGSDNSAILNIELFDDGGGLDLSRIASSTRAKNALSDSRNSLQKLCNVIFAEGFSSKEQASQISGRGIGLAEVKRLLEDHGGKIEVVPRDFEDWTECKSQTAKVDKFPIKFVILLPVDFNEKSKIA